jgi:sRNA-binding regulator protein Hfq
MSNKENFIGKTVSLFLVGGWTVSGKVASLDDDKFIIEQDGGLYMVFRDKISGLFISEEARAVDNGQVKEKESDHYPGKGLEYTPNPTSRESTSSELFPMNKISYDESSLSIPRNLLNDDIGDVDDFSTFYAGGHDLRNDGTPNSDSDSNVYSINSKMDFKVEKDDTEEEDK